MTNTEILKFNAQIDEKVFIEKYNENAEIFATKKINSIEKAKILIYDDKLMMSVDGNSEVLL